MVLLMLVLAGCSGEVGDAARSPGTVVIDPTLRASGPPLYAVAVGDPAVWVTGEVTPADARIEVVVTSSGGQVAAEGVVQAEGGYFETEVELAAGHNTVTVTATGGDSASETVRLDARYEPSASVEFAFLREVSTGQVVVDYAQWLTGEAASQAAYEDGYIASADEGLPNDFYIRTGTDRSRTLPLSDDVSVWLTSPAAGSITQVEVNLDEWLGLFHDGIPRDPETDSPPAGGSPHNGYLGAGTIGAPYWLVSLDGTVIAIEQQYLP